jgi:hypothetical protein
LNAAVARDDVEGVVALFGSEGRQLFESSDPATARRNREVFAAAMAEGWRLADERHYKVLVVGNEGWPFPIPLVEGPRGWQFDTAAGKEEVLARRIGRNELTAIQTCRTYVAAQKLYASRPHDDRPAGLYAMTFRSDAGRHNGLYWQAERGGRRSPLGDLMSDAEVHAKRSANGEAGRTPFHGYYFKILTAQGSAAAGGERDYLVNGEMSGGFALVAWPARYDGTGVMTFIVNHDGIVYEKDLGPDTPRVASATIVFNPDASWTVVE